MVDEEIAFDPDIHASYIGRLLKVRETVNDEWRDGVPESVCAERDAALCRSSMKRADE